MQRTPVAVLPPAKKMLSPVLILIKVAQDVLITLTDGKSDT